MIQVGSLPNHHRGEVTPIVAFSVFLALLFALICAWWVVLAWVDPNHVGMTHSLFSTAIGAVTLTGLIALVWFSRKGELEHFAEFERAGFQVRRSFWLGDRIVGSHAGLTFEHYVCDGEGPKHRVIEIPSNTATRLVIEPAEGMSVRKFFSRPVKTGDADFDAKHAVFGDADFIETFLDAATRARLHRILDGSLSDLKKDAKGITVTGEGITLLSAKELTSVVAELAGLRRLYQ